MVLFKKKQNRKLTTNGIITPIKKIWNANIYPPPFKKK